jgi:hypothetical protein
MKKIKIFRICFTKRPFESRFINVFFNEYVNEYTTLMTVLVSFMSVKSKYKKYLFFGFENLLEKIFSSHQECKYSIKFE